MAGLAAALTGYIAQSFNPTGFEPFSAASVEALAIVVLVASVASGVKRISLSNHLLQVGQKKIEQTEHLATLQTARETAAPVQIRGVGTLSPEQADDMLGQFQEMKSRANMLERKLRKRAVLAARLRDIFLLAGFLLLVLARLLKAGS
jgi:hypothetical protein